MSILTVSDGTYDEFECALSNDKHYFNEPIALQCGHSSCKNCLPKGQVIKKCRICGLEINSSDQSVNVSVNLKKLFKRNLSELVAILETQTLKSLNKLKNDFDKNNIEIEEKSANLELEIETKIESIKTELDKHFEQYKIQIKEAKEKCFNENKERFDNNKVDNFTKVYEKLKNEIENKSDKIEENFFEYQKNLQNINKTINDMNQKFYQLSFTSSTSQIKEEVIGKINFINESLTNLTIKEALITQDLEIHSLNIQPSELCILPDGSLCITNYSYNEPKGSITLYNRDLNIIETINQIDNKPIKPFGMVLNKDRLYISDLCSHSVIMTDFKFKKIKSFGSHGVGTDQLDAPYGVDYANDFIYVCDNNNKRIVKLSSDLDFIGLFNLQYFPWLVKALKETLFVVSGRSTELCFYNIETFELKYKYDYYIGRISVFKSCFYHVNSNNKTVNVFDEDGKLIDSININGMSDHVTYCWDGCMMQFHDDLLISCYQKSKLLTLKTQN